MRNYLLLLVPIKTRADCMGISFVSIALDEKKKKYIQNLIDFVGCKEKKEVEKKSV
jgi:hypothetical protein